MIAAFLPMSVQVMRLQSQGEAAAGAYVQNVIARAMPWAFAAVAAEAGPWVLRMVFPDYRVDPLVPRIMFMTLSFIPIGATVGNLLDTSSTEFVELSSGRMLQVNATYFRR